MDSSSVMVWLFNQLARLPLSALHRLGSAMGWLIYLLSGRYAKRLRENLGRALIFLRGKEMPSEIDLRKVLRANVSEAGKSILELPWVWRRSLEEIIASVKQCEGWEHVDAAHAQGKGVILLTPHFGCFEIISLYVAARMPMTSMYSQPSREFLNTLMLEGRQRGQMKLAPADLGGVRMMLKALKRGEVIGILPDQVPGNGDGEWTPFFGRTAYTMTLVGRLLEASNAVVVMSHCIRLPHGEGYALHFAPLSLDPALSIPRQINAAQEAIIRNCPEQYLWSYNRYKVPRGVQPPEISKEQ